MSELNGVTELNAITAENAVNGLKGVARVGAVRWPLGRVVDQDQVVPAVLSWPIVVDAARAVNRRDLTHADRDAVVVPSSPAVVVQVAVLVAGLDVVLNWPMDVGVDLGATWDVRKVVVQVAVPAVKVHELKGVDGAETAIESLGVMTANVGPAARVQV